VTCTWRSMCIPVYSNDRALDCWVWKCKGAASVRTNAYFQRDSMLEAETLRHGRSLLPPSTPTSVAPAAACSLLWRADVIESHCMARVGPVALSATFVSIPTVGPRSHCGWQVTACRKP
jgi:hypothetical protein